MNIFYNKKGTMHTTVLVAIVFTVVAGIGLFVYFSKIPKGIQKKQINNSTTQMINNSGVLVQNQNANTVQNQPSEPEKTAWRDNCVNLPSNLESCSAYKCVYLYQKAGVELINEVFGLVDGKCKYREETRNVGININCELSENTRQTLAVFYRDLKLYDPENKTGEPAQSFKIYIVGDNNEVSDPLYETVRNGECKIEG